MRNSNEGESCEFGFRKRFLFCGLGLKMVLKGEKRKEEVV